MLRLRSVVEDVRHLAVAGGAHALEAVRLGQEDVRRLTVDVGGAVEGVREGFGFGARGEDEDRVAVFDVEERVRWFGVGG